MMQGLWRNRVTLSAIVMAIAAGGGAWVLHVQRSLQARPTQTLRAVTKTTNCQAAQSLADSGCTPGAVFKTATKRQVCIPGYTLLVRGVSNVRKQEVLQAYSLKTVSAKTYEVDHLVSLSLGGSNDAANLWPESAIPVPGFHEKDQVENYLHRQVCRGKMSLDDAQTAMATDWRKFIGRK